MINENTKAKEFILPSTNGKTLKLKDLKGKFVVIYFYPKMIHQAVRLKLMILANSLLNLKN